MKRKLTYYHGRGLGELYDLETDPGEVENLWGDSAHAGERQQLMGCMIDHMEPLERGVSRICYA